MCRCSQWFQNGNFEFMANPKKLSFNEHLEELRRRILICLVVVFVLFAVAFTGFSEAIFKLFSAPILKSLTMAGLAEGVGSLHTKEPAEALLSQLRLSFLASICVAMPFILFQIWRFIAPGLYGHEKRAGLPFVFMTTAAFALGVLFCYFVILPYGYAFLLSYAVGSGVTPTIMVGEYVSATTNLLLAFGLVFEVPVVISFLARLGVVDHNMLARFRPHAVVACLILGAIITPPDVVSQIMLAIPLYLLYELSIFGSRLMVGNRKRALLEKEKRGAEAEAREELEYERELAEEFAEDPGEELDEHDNLENGLEDDLTVRHGNNNL